MQLRPPRANLVEIIRDPTLTPSQKVVLGVVVSHFGKAGKCFVKLDVIVDEVGTLQKRAVQKVLSDLIDLGFLQRYFTGRRMEYRAGWRLLLGTKSPAAPCTAEVV